MLIFWTASAQLDEKQGKHKHYKSWGGAENSSRRRNSFKSGSARVEFRILHYAGVVKYNVTGFIDKNNDLLFRDLKELMGSSLNIVAKACFPATELDSQKRPKTAGTQFKNSLNALVDILMVKQPSYVRCIKPNHEKKPGLFERELVQHQSKYLGLMENLRVRRAGFAFRRRFEIFLERYKVGHTVGKSHLLCNNATLMCVP